MNAIGLLYHEECVTLSNSNGDYRMLSLILRAETSRERKDQETKQRQTEKDTICGRKRQVEIVKKQNKGN